MTAKSETPPVERPGDRKPSQGGLRLWHGFLRWDLASVSIALVLICVPAVRLRSRLPLGL